MPTSSRPSFADLQDTSRFDTVLHVSHRQIASAVQPLLYSRNPVAIGFWLLNLLVIAWLGARWYRSGLGFEAFPLLCAGMAGGWILLLPVHEHLHALAYRLVGAGNVHVHYAWRTLTAYCIADRAVVNGAEFLYVALAPFVVLNSLLAVALFFLPPGPAGLLVGGALLLHLGATSGDVAFVILVVKSGTTRSWTVDDSASQSSWFVAEK